MPAEIQYLDLHGIREPKPLLMRDTRPVKGLEERYKVTRTGRVWSIKKKGWMVDGQSVLMQVNSRQVWARTDYLVALSWLSAGQREAIRAALRAAPTPSWPLDALAAQYGVSKYAIRAVGHYAEEHFDANSEAFQRYGENLVAFEDDTLKRTHSYQAVRRIT